MEGSVVTRKLLSFASYTFLVGEVLHLVYELVQFCKQKRQKSSLESRKPSHLWNTAIFFPDELNSVASRNQLLWYLNQAKKSISICMYCLTIRAFEQVIAERQANGVKVKIITMRKSIQKLELNGLSVKIKPTNVADELMHHKFVIIDDEALLTGSLNWTAEGFGGNNENVMVTTNPRAVKNYLGEFQKIWDSCESPES